MDLPDGRPGSGLRFGALLSVAVAAMGAATEVRADMLPDLVVRILVLVRLGACYIPSPLNRIVRAELTVDGQVISIRVDEHAVVVWFPTCIRPNEDGEMQSYV